MFARKGCYRNIPRVVLTVYLSDCSTHVCIPHTTKIYGNSTCKTVLISSRLYVFPYVPPMTRSTHNPGVYEVRYVYTIILRETYVALRLISYTLIHRWKGAMYASRSLRFTMYYYAMIERHIRAERNCRKTTHSV